MSRAVTTLGAAFRLRDGGSTWRDGSVGLDPMPAEVRVESPSVATAIGDAGLSLELSGMVPKR